MKPISAVEFRSRPMVVTVKEHCEHCKTLQPNVEAREHRAFYPFAYLVEIKSCEPCFDTAKKQALEDARALYASYC